MVFNELVTLGIDGNSISTMGFFLNKLSIVIQLIMMGLYGDFICVL